MKFKSLVTGLLICGLVFINANIVFAERSESLGSSFDMPVSVSSNDVILSHFDNDNDYYIYEIDSLGQGENEYIELIFSPDAENRGMNYILYNENKEEIKSGEVNIYSIEENTLRFHVPKNKYYYLKLYKNADKDNLRCQFLTNVKKGEVGDDTKVSVYRLYNPNSGKHFFTKDIDEKYNLMNLGWKYEGVAFETVKKSLDSMYYRLYNPVDGSHYYTDREAYIDMYVEDGWKYEGIAWYLSDNNWNDDNIPVYELHTQTDMLYTMDKEEADNLEDLGWYGNMIEFYAF